MKKFTLSLLTTVVALSPLSAFAQQLDSTRSGNPTVAQAQDAQTSIQNNTNSAAAVGVGMIHQNATQTSVQDQLDFGAYGVPATPDAQTSVQVNSNKAAAIGDFNYIDQDATQTSVQDQVDLNQYLPY